MFWLLGGISESSRGEQGVRISALCNGGFRSRAGRLEVIAVFHGRQRWRAFRTLASGARDWGAKKVTGTFKWV